MRAAQHLSLCLLCLAAGFAGGRWLHAAAPAPAAAVVHVMPAARVGRVPKPAVSAAARPATVAAGKAAAVAAFRDRLAELVKLADARADSEAACCAIRRLAWEWRCVDSDSALAALRSLPKGDARAAFFRVLGSAWVAGDPEASLDFALTVWWDEGDASPRVWAVAGVATNPDAAFEAITRVPSARARGYLLSEFFDECAIRDPATAARFAAALPPGANRTKAMQTVVGIWSDREPRAALAWLQSQPPDPGLDDMRAYLAIKLEPRPPREVLEELKPQLMALFRLTESTPMSRPDSARWLRFQNTLEHWAELDFDAARAWIQALPPALLSGAIGNLDFSRRWQERDPEGFVRTCLQAWQSDGVDVMDADAIGYMMRSTLGVYYWARQNPQAAVAAVAALAPGELRDSLYSQALDEWARNAPAEAAAYVAALPPAEFHVALTVLEPWLNQDTPGAAAWVAGFPEGATRLRAVNRVVDVWAQDDETAALDWLVANAEAADWDVAVTTLARQADDPVYAWALAETVGDPTVRQRELEVLAQQWMADEPDTVGELLMGSDLPTETIELLLLREP